MSTKKGPIETLRDALAMYLAAGHKEARREASVSAKTALAMTADVMEPEEAINIGLVAAKKTAEGLARVWIERERNQRTVLNSKEKLTRGNQQSEATKACRRELQYAFRLVRRLGSGPITCAESEEYLKQEMNYPYPL